MFAALLASVLIPSNRKAVLYKANDLSDYSSLNNVPDIVFLSNEHYTDLTFRLLEKELYAVCLYFRVTGVNGEKPETDGKIVASLLQGDQLVKTVDIPIADLYYRYKISSILSCKEKEIVFDLDGLQSGEFLLSLRAEGMSEKTRVSLMGGIYVPEYISLRNHPNKFEGVLNIIETKQKRHPYTWYLVLLISLCFLFYVTRSVVERRDNTDE